MMGRVRWTRVERMRPGRIRKSLPSLIAMTAMCRKTAEDCRFSQKRNVRHLAAHCTGLIKTLVKQGHDRPKPPCNVRSFILPSFFPSPSQITQPTQNSEALRHSAPICASVLHFELLLETGTKRPLGTMFSGAFSGANVSFVVDGTAALEPRSARSYCAVNRAA